MLKTDSQVSPAASAKQAANLQPAWNCPCQGHYDDGAHDDDDDYDDSALDDDDDYVPMLVLTKVFVKVNIIWLSK